ncbi:ABC transporter permease [Croceibacterium sp. LX-88]|jgi:ABC-2 type transport system permease protein|uniref:ABC transporter permease n=1 Tax=Croceibacterium selenioxidans TaxID=2838833 RepID=A0ABS5W3G0_9SPHN|nr:ABC transporter permease [Croceibacterium selenioxidans]MBT2133647.1 ABC transporter permease [Croceibacterium selenioxidans]
MREVWHIFHLGIKELISLSRDPVLIFLILYTFTFSVYTPSKSAVMDVVNASIAIVDEDSSEASRAVHDAMLPPLFLPPRLIDFAEINPDMDRGRYTFVINIPPEFQDELAEDGFPDVQIITDATAMSQAGRGPGYISAIINSTVEPYWSGRGNPDNQPLVGLQTRARFNPNMLQGWFVAINQLINNISVLAIFLCGAAVLREREHGNIEHLLVMPLRPYELMFAKIWANGLVVIVAAMASLFLVVKGLIGVPISGSIPLFAFGLMVYLFSVTALGIMLSTMVRSMPQFGLLAFPTFIVMSLLSGGQTPLESMPVPLQKIMQFVPSTHFVSFSQAVLFRDATPAMVWPLLAKMFLIGMAYTFFTLTRFRKMLAAIQ